LIDPDILSVPGTATEPASGELAPAVDQALDWLIRLENPSAADCIAFDAWLVAAPEHAAAFAKAASVWQGATLRRAAASLQVQRTPRLGRRLLARWKPLATAAVLLVGVCSFANVPMRLQADHLTQVGERQRIELQDGSKVLLNTHSAIASTFDIDHHRTRLLQGEAFFEVSGNPALPLEVQAGPVLASVHDTAFAVSYRDGEAQVKVQRGNVDLQANDAQSLRLSAGDSIRIGPHGFARRERMDPAADLAWVQGRLVFEDRPLGEVLAELRRYYPGWIVSRNAQFDGMKVTGNYRLDQPLDVLRSLAHVTSANLQEYPGLVILN
jgi:transmembrane sensor